jgi:AcrR family transcriptional regulator
MITVQKLLDTAFAMAKEEGFSNVTARKVADKAGCSTQPIFRIYRNMEELSGAVYERAAAFFQTYYSRYPRRGKTPFCNLGMAYISFAREERHLFELLFVAGGKHRRNRYELLNGREGNIVYEIHLARIAGCLDASSLFMKMWMFIHGAACMTLTGDYDLSDEETYGLLESSYEAFGKAAEQKAAKRRPG